MNIQKAIGCRIAGLREMNGITQQQLADFLGISRQRIGQYENGERLINIELLLKIADYFNVSMDYLFCRTPNQTTNTDLQGVLNYTGLSERGLDNIMRLVNPIKAKYIKIDDFTEEVQEEIDTKAQKYTREIFEDYSLFAIVTEIESFCSEYIKLAKNYPQSDTSDIRELARKVNIDEKFEYLLFKAQKNIQEYITNIAYELYKKELDENGTDNTTQE